MLTSSVTVFTLEVSKRALLDGAESVGARCARSAAQPLAADSMARLLPVVLQTLLVDEIRQLDLSDLRRLVPLADTAVTTPSAPIVTDCVPAGMVIAG